MCSSDLLLCPASASTLLGALGDPHSPEKGPQPPVSCLPDAETESERLRRWLEGPQLFVAELGLI